jgi:Protein of unknown function (DUF3618)
MAQDSDEVARNANSVTPTPPATSPPSASTDELRARIHETRAEMSQTINAIQERLSPDHLVSETKDAITDATVGRARQVAQGASRAADIARDSLENPGRVVQRVKANPVRAAVIGAAAMWLTVRALRRPRAAPRDRVLRGNAARTTWRRRSGIGRVRPNGRLLVGVGTGMACWGMWRARRSVSGEALLDRHPDVIAGQPVASVGAQPR